MLRTLSIRNLAIIDSLELEFGPGLNVLTGETGAGKSILIGALELVLGSRGSTDWIRAGESRAIADAVFEVSSATSFLDVLTQAGYDAPDGELLLTRELHASGRSVARIGGRPATLTQLRELGQWLVDLHGQHEHQSLLDVSRHLDILDDWAGPAIQQLVESARSLWTRVRELRTELERIETNARERLRLMDLCRYQIQEITAAQLMPGEDQALLDESRRLRNIERLREATAAALNLLYEGEHAAADLLARASEYLTSASSLDTGLQEMAEALRNLSYEAQELGRSLARYASALEADPARLSEVEDRLSRISDLKRKYGATIEEVLAFADQAAAQLVELEHAEERTEELSRQLAEAEESFRDVCSRLSALRQETARRFEAAVSDQLSDVALGGSRFAVSLTTRPPGPTGADAGEFLFAANAGEPLRPLARIASGGEISRVMLAIKSAAASQSPLPTMVFDEVDAGIGGRTADAIATKMKQLAQHAQVICITHLAPIAAAADIHYLIEKRESHGRTIVHVQPLTKEQRIEELARMLAGTRVTDAVREHVRTLLARHGH